MTNYWFRGEIMELKRVYVDGYRNVSDTTIEIKDITSVLSVNNYGKSNLLLSIVFGLSFLQQHSKIKQAMINDVKVIPGLKSKYGAPFRFEIDCETKWNEKVYFIKYAYSFTWGGRKEQGGKVASESLQVSENNKDFTTYIKREENRALYKSSKTGRCATRLSIDDADLVINKLSAFDGLFYNAIIKELLNINVYVDRHFDTDSGYGITFMSEQELTDLTLKPEVNIPKTLYRIKNDYPDKYELLCNAYKSLFPSVKDLEVQEFSSKMPNIIIKDGNNDIPSFSDKVYILYVNDDNLSYHINFMAMSVGERRILLLLTFVVLAQINNYDLICIEEPENSINPNLLKRFLYTIKELSEDTKILYSSHSPYLINYMEPENIYLGLPTDNGVATFKKIKTNTNNIKKLLRTLQDNELELGDYLFDLMSGSSDDAEELLSYVE